MKKGTLFSIIIILAVGLSSCGAKPASNANQGNGTPRELPLATKLLIGTLKLEKTPNTVNTEQAETLLPLWQLYKSLNASNTAASQETDSVVQQIQAAMTSDQITAIDGMNLSGRDIFTTMQDLGLANQANAQGTPFSQGGFPGGGQGFNPGGGPPPGGGGGGPNFGQGGGQNLNPQQIATAQARRAQGGFGGNRVPTALLDALIKLLESKGMPTSTPTSTVTSTPTEEVISTLTPSTTTPSATPTP